MRVEITTPPGIFAEGMLKGVIAEQDASHPHKRCCQIAKSEAPEMTKTIWRLRPSSPVLPFPQSGPPWAARCLPECRRPAAECAAW